MKTRKIIFSIIILFTLFVNIGIAQDVKIISVEKKYNGKTYIVDSIAQNTLRSSWNNNKLPFTIENKNKIDFSKSIFGTCYLKETTPLSEIFNKAVSKEKIKALALNDKSRIVISFIVDAKTGKVVWTRFIAFLSDDIDSKTEVTLKDIEKLETLFNNYSFEKPKNCNTRVDYITWFRPFYFSKLAAEEEKKA